MDTEQAKQLVREQTLQPGADYSDWTRVSDNARQSYVLNACQQCEKRKMGKVDHRRVLERMRQLYAMPHNQKLGVSAVFGIAFASIIVTEGKR